MPSTIILNNKKNDKKQWSMGHMILWGFNFIVGYAFVVGLNDSYKPTGNFTIISLLIGGIIALITGLSFGRLSQKIAGNGGIFLYTRKIFSRKVSYYAAFWQYIQAPVVGISAVLGMLWAFNGIKIGNGSAQTNIWIFIIVIFFFLMAWFIVQFGFTSSKYSLYFLWTLKWLILGAAIVMALIQIPHFTTNISGAGNTYVKKLSYSGLLHSVFTFFFAFGGFEGIVVVAGDLKNSKKNMIRSIITILILALLFYVFYFYITLGAIGSSNDPANKYKFGYDKDFNPINVLLRKYNVQLKFGVSIVTTIILILVTGSQIANKSTSRIQNGWVNAKMLAAYSHGGFLPKSVGIINKYNQYTLALAIDSLITLFLVFIFYMIYRFTNYNIAGSLDLYTISAFLQYLFSLLAVITLWRKKILKIKLWEILSYFLIYSVLIILLISYFYDGISLFINDIVQHKKITADETKVVIAVGTYLILGIFAYFLYKYGNHKKWYKNDIYKKDYDHHQLKIESETNF